ncbi:Fc receptor-like A isoform 2-T2 [Acanthopagrus schlegelii]
MEVTTLLYRLLMFECILLGTQVQNTCTQKSDAVFLRIHPNRQQHFEYDPVSFHCEGGDSLSLLRRVRSSEEMNPECQSKRTSTGFVCTISNIYAADSGEYWCETKGGQRSNSVYITVTAGSVILESPALPVIEGDTVSLNCRSKAIIPNLQAYFYKDDLLMENSSAGEMAIINVSKLDVGLYMCSIPGVGESPGNWLAVRAGSVILESPVLPVMEGNNVTLSCRKKNTSSNLTADFYKDGLLIGSSSTGEMIIHGVSKSDEGLYKCNLSGAGESSENWLAVRALQTETCPFFHLLLLLRTVFTILLVPLLLLLVGLLHCGKLRVTHK